MARISGITPSGHAQLGNYLGAIRQWARNTEPDDLYFVADMHATTRPYNPQKLRVLTREQFAILLAAGVPAEHIFVQSDVMAELASLTWILECCCTYGEAHRMTQFKEKSHKAETVKLGLLTYPVLMASDILLHGADEIPVGDDQAQHVELARTLAKRFNRQYGDVFALPKTVRPTAAARVRDLADPSSKMSKSAREAHGVVFVLDSPDLVRRKVMRAVTDGLARVEYRPTEQPGVANLLEILAACTGGEPHDIAANTDDYAQLKSTTADAVVELLRPIRKRTNDLLADREELTRIRRDGARLARKRAQSRLAAAMRLSGLGGDFSDDDFSNSDF